MTDIFGDRCKSYERQAEHRLMPCLPVLARLDGRAFHTFTRDLKRPYDAGMSRLMIETTKHLVKEFIPKVGYTQSDEITLAWYHPEETSDGRLSSKSTGNSGILFEGRVQKLSSVLAGAASAVFNKLLPTHLPEKKDATPHFDCRVWQVPTLRHALDVFVWREDDATKNSLSMAAQAYYSHRELHEKNSKDKHELLHAMGVNWNDYPTFFKRGSYVARRVFERKLTDAEWEKIPEHVRPQRDAVYERGEVVELEMPPIRKVGNAVEVLFEGAEPVWREPAPPLSG